VPNLEVVANSLVSGVLLGGVLALTALGLSIALGVMRLVNLAHGELLVGGAYLGYYLLRYTGMDPIAGLLVVGAAMALVSLPFQRLLLAPLAGKGMEAPMITMFGVSVILQNLYLLAFSADTRAIDTPYAASAVHLGPVTRTAFGRELRASSYDADAAAAMGVDVKRVHALTFALGAACAAMGGVLLGTAFSFNPSAGGTYLLISFAVVVLGGVGNIFGTLVAGVALGLLQSLGAVVFGDGYRDLVGLVLFLLALALRPQGIAGVR
jgi:branched-chain amino acid transport system permease protein